MSKIRALHSFVNTLQLPCGTSYPEVWGLVIILHIAPSYVKQPVWSSFVTCHHAGAVYELFAFNFNLGHVSNAVVLWLGMRPSDIFVYVFFPPFLLDLSTRLDFYMLKKVCVCS